MSLPTNFSREALSVSLKPVSSTKGLYLLQTPTKIVYSTAIRECDTPGKASLRSLTRQLFVGFDDLRIIHQEKRPVGQSVIISIARASVDKHPVELIAYSAQIKNCTLDNVYWSTTPDKTGKSTIDYLIADITIFERIFDKVLSNYSAEL